MNCRTVNLWFRRFFVCRSADEGLIGIGRMSQFFGRIVFEVIVIVIVELIGIRFHAGGDHLVADRLSLKGSAQNGGSIGESVQGSVRFKWSDSLCQSVANRSRQWLKCAHPLRSRDQWGVRGSRHSVSRLWCESSLSTAFRAPKARRGSPMTRLSLRYIWFVFHS